LPLKAPSPLCAYTDRKLHAPEASPRVAMIRCSPDDESLEVTPLNLRMRKRILNTDMRRKAAAGRDVS
jgi:predicted membrane GTPase involved in stress response